MVGLEDTRLVLALELEDLVHISPARIVPWAQHTDCVEQGQLEAWSLRDVLESRYSSQALAQVARMRLAGGG